MKVTDFGMPKLAVPRLGLASFRRRIIFRATFLFLALATVALAIVLLKEEKQRSYRNYQEGFRKTQSELAAKLRHPSGQLALINAARLTRAATPLRPLLLPYGALDFDDQNKAQQAVEMAGCAVQYADGSSACAAIGNNPYAGGFLYVVGSFASGELVGRARGALDLSEVHRARVSLEMPGESRRWIAPFEAMDDGGPVVRGRLTAFSDTGERLPANARPVRDFRGWLWQSRECAEAAKKEDACARRSFFSIRLPVDVFREALFQKPRPVWPPPRLDEVQVRVEVLGPDSDRPLFDSDLPAARPPFSLDELAQTLLPGETLRIRKSGSERDLLTIKGAEDASGVSLPWLTRIIRKLPVEEGDELPISGRELIATPLGVYEAILTGDAAGLDRALSIAATRLSWFVGAMLAAIALAWVVIEIGLIRRITVLTKRAAAVSYNVNDPQIDKRIGDLDVSDLRGSDELGILAGSLSTLLQRVKDDVTREHIRAQQERDMWHAVGHEIMSPLQSLMVLHGTADDPSHRYVQRMQQAVKVLYGTASPSEALEAATLQVGAIDLDEFLLNVAANAHFAGIEGVQYTRAAAPVLARADEYSLEDVVTHILRNADRHRRHGTPITIGLSADAASAHVTIRNEGAPIDPALIDKIFEYGVSDAPEDAAGEHRGQGLFVARTYMAKMGGTISARNDGEGVTFTLSLQRA